MSRKCFIAESENNVINYKKYKYDSVSMMKKIKTVIPGIWHIAVMAAACRSESLSKPEDNGRSCKR